MCNHGNESCNNHLVASKSYVYFIYVYCIFKNNNVSNSTIAAGHYKCISFQNVPHVAEKKKDVIFLPTVRKIKLDVGKARGEILMS